MGNKSRQRKKKAAAKSRVKRAVLREAEERERDRIEKIARRERRRAALIVATAFVKQHMPRPERINTFCEVMKEEMVIDFTRRYKTTRMEEALWWMSYDCRLCGMGKWYCQCHLGDEEMETEEEVQDEGLQTPMKKSSLPSMSPEDVTAKSTGFMKRDLFKGK